MFEIEFRSRFNLEKFNALKKYLDEHAENLGPDDKDTYFYIFPDKLLKLVNNISKNNAKVSLKLNRIGDGAAFPEIEFYFPSEEFHTAVKLFNALSLSVKIMHEPQKRINYRYKDCEIALKHSNTWGYHLEIEQLIDSEEKRADAEAHIRKVADELGVRLMSEEELKKFTREAESRA